MIVRSAPRPPLGAEVPSLSHTSNKWWLSCGINKRNCVAAYQPQMAASLTASYVNLAKPGTYDCVPGAVAPQFREDRGWIFTGTQNLWCGFKVGNFWSAIVKCSNVTSFAAVFGSRVGSSGLMIQLGPAAPCSFRYPETAPGGTIQTQGVFAIAGKNAFIGTTKFFSGFTATVTQPQYQMAIGGLATDGVMQYYSNSDVKAAAFYDIPLSDQQIFALVDAMNRL